MLQSATVSVTIAPLLLSSPQEVTEVVEISPISSGPFVLHSPLPFSFLTDLPIIPHRVSSTAWDVPEEGGSWLRTSVLAHWYSTNA